jgi:hypothetical protein
VRILLVDDEPLARLALQAAVERLDGLELCRRVRAHAATHQG